MSEPEEPVGNPLRAELDDLVRRVQEATGRVPGMSAPLTAVGDGDAWRGPAARRFRDQHLDPARSGLYGPLDRLVDDVASVRDGLPREVSPERARELRREWGL
ncbi:hypothetical protein BJF80_13630 [Serinicoccus sp. CUA-874]|uniref:hypothetical protein n=1 Tax=Serinicoccus sp. CUA-874 TaxID=1517939 RepID=UPI000967A94F|nr:hypothetical protein [Serinicoccus sp. CUA-874]OLT18893.1 hypothetical protein BJF80_13630 [Serinicoccus sp. CUA-874]